MKNAAGESLMCHPLPHHHHHRHRHRRHHRRPFWDRVGVAGASALSVMATKGEGGRPQSIYVFLSTFGQEEDIDGAERLKQDPPASQLSHTHTDTSLLPAALPFPPGSAGFCSSFVSSMFPPAALGLPHSEE